VLLDHPTTYLRLDERGGAIASDSSGTGNDGTYQSGVTFQSPGPLVSDPADTAVRWKGGPGTAVTQSGATLPSGNSARTVEFWIRTVGCTERPTLIYGGSGVSNDRFEAQLQGCNFQPTTLNLYTGGQTFTWSSLPGIWWDGVWHLFDVTYDGTDVSAYMDGQTLGSFLVAAPLATVTPGNGFAVADYESGNCCSPVDFAEAAVYPGALTPASIDAHWTAAESSSGPCPAAPTDAYGRAVVSDAPALYLRAGDLAGGSGGRLAFDSSGHCTASDPNNGAYTTPTTGQPDGPALGSADGAATWPGGAGTVATQSGATLPSGNASRTVEFWSRTVGCTERPTVVYGASGGSNDQFEVQLQDCNFQPLALSLYTDGQSFPWRLPASWDDGGWHLFDVTYDGSTAIGYMDGQVIGSSPVPTALSTVAPGNGLAIADYETGNCCSPVDLAEVAVYPAALPPARIDAHFEARYATPPGTSVIAGTARFGSGGGARGARAQACPTTGAACTLDPYPADPSGFFHILAPDGTYTVTLFPPAGSLSGTRTFGPLTVSPDVFTLSAVFSAPGALADGISVTSPGNTAQHNVVPSLATGTATTWTLTGQCHGGFGTLTVTGVNPSTGQDETRVATLSEVPPGSGTYVGQLPPVAPLHGSGDVHQQIVCPDTKHMIPDGGPAVGGAPVVLGGTGFTGAKSVAFGATPAASFEVIGDDMIEAESPAGSGTVPVTVTLANSSTVTIGTYSYFGVNSLSATTGPASGGTSVAIHGYGFTDVKGVVFGVTPATSYTVVSPTEVDAVAPPGVGTVDVQVVNDVGTSQLVTADYFTYQGGPPAFADVSEGTAPAAVVTLADQVSGICTTPATSAQCGGISVERFKVALECAAGIAGDLLGAGGYLAMTVGAFVEVPPVAAALVLGGAVVGVVATVLCLSDYFDGQAYFDPSGMVVDTNGNPLSGAIATILSRAADGTFNPVAASSGTIRPATNPETTPASGEFDWDALSGTYEVKASSPGCSAPGNPSQSYAFTAPVTIPPPAVGLVLTLACPDSAPPPTPTVTTLAPSGGSRGGGNVVDISGTGLAGATSVHFGATAAPQMRVLSPYAIAAVAPAGTGTADVTVTTPAGTSSRGSADQYAYIVPAVTPKGPVVSGVTPANGPVSGGSKVTITGTSLGDAFAVDFGGTAATQVTVISTTEVQAVAPAVPFPGRVDIFVTTSDGTSAPTPADIYTYGSPPPATATNLSVTAAPNPAPYGHPVTLTATVSPTDGGGTVEFAADGSAIGGCRSVQVVRAGATYEATCPAPPLAGGKHTITAAYSGDASYAAASNSTKLNIDAAPMNSIPPVASGSPTNSAIVSSTTGTWSGAPPPTYAYQWQRCAPNCSNIAGAAASTYRLTGANVGAKVRAVVTATNDAGKAEVGSNEVGPVQPSAAQIAAALRTVLAPSGKSATIGHILKADGFTFTFHAPGPGTLAISWYEVAAGAHLGGGTRPVLAAATKVSLVKAGKVKIKVHVTTKGRRILRTAHTIRLTSKVTLTPAGGKPNTERRSFRLGR
jgi:hypothetical protein